MNKNNTTLVLLFTIIFMVYAQNNKLQFKFGPNLASLTNTGSKYNGVVSLQSVGGSGTYRFDISSLPAGWTAQANAITIPNIVNLKGTYTIKAKVTDLKTGTTIQGNINLIVDGVNVIIQPSTPSNPNQASAGNKSSNLIGIKAGSIQLDDKQVAKGSPTSSSPSALLYQNYPGLELTNSRSQIKNSISSVPLRPPTIPNITPRVISNTQAKYNPQRDAIPVTIDDLKFQAKFLRQQNAGKAIANLLSIIQQLTANINAAQSDLGKLQNRKKDAQRQNNECNNKMKQLSNKKVRISNAVKERQDKTNDATKNTNNLQSILNDLTKARDGFILKKSQIEKARPIKSARLSSLQIQIKDCTTNKQRVQRQFNNINSQIEQVNNNIKRIQDDVSNVPQKISLLNKEIPILDDKIDDLKKQIESVQQQKQKMIKDKDSYQRSIIDSGRKLIDLQKQLRNLKNFIPDLEDQINKANDKCQKMQSEIDNLKGELDEDIDYKILLDQINTQQLLIQNKRQEISRINDDIRNLPSEILTLLQQLSKVQETARRQQFICSDTAESAGVALKNYEALVNKYQSQTKWLNQTNINLQKARSEKEAADFEVNQMVIQRSKILPFSTRTIGNGLTPSGSSS